VHLENAEVANEVLVRVPLDADSLERLRQLALAERRATSDQAAVILIRALARHAQRRRDPEASR
jgi:hypothetical protein